MIKTIKLTNIRSFKVASFDFVDGINLIVGPNGSGKTSILESIALFGIGKFQSQARDFQAVSFAKEVGRVELDVEQGSRAFQAEAVIQEKSKVFKVNSNVVPASKIIGFIKTVYFNPETIDLVSGSPRVRRAELDQTIGQVEPIFVRSLLKFRRVIKERNSLLKRIFQGFAKENELDFWDQQFIELSREIYQKRQEFLAQINASIGGAHQRLMGDGDDLGVRYSPSCEYDRIDEVLLANRDLDIRVNQTGVGPHRDDFEFYKEKKKHIFYRDQSSRGEQRLAAAAFKVASASFLEKKSQEKPVMIFDDIFSELDEGHRGLIASVIGDGQVFISATDEKVVPKEIQDRSKKILI